MRTASAVLALFLSISPALAASNDDLRTASDGLELFYIENAAYSPVVCRDAEVEETTYVLCNSPLMDKDTGDLWAVLDGPTLVPMNGKAIQRLKAHGKTISAMDTTPIATKTTQEAFPDLPSLPPILEAFR